MHSVLFTVFHIITLDSRLSSGADPRSQYIYLGSKLLLPVVSFIELVKTSFQAVWERNTHHVLDLRIVDSVLKGNLGITAQASL